MKIIHLIAVGLAVSFVVPASAKSSHAVRGYVRKDGTYVAPHRATNPNNTRMDNWSTKGNVNPYTGKEGSVDPYQPPRIDTYPRPTSTSSSNPRGY